MASSERRIITKVAYDTSEGVKGNAALRSEIVAVGEAAKKSTAVLEGEYRRLVGAIDPADKAQQKYARAVATTSELVERGKLSQELANETLRKAGSFYSQQAAAINNLGDVFDKVGGRTAVFAGQLFAVWASFEAGWKIGEKLRSKLNELTEGGFDRVVQSASGATAIAEAWIGVQDDAADAADTLRNHLALLRLHGIDPTGLSAEEAAKKVRGLTAALLAREQIGQQTKALLPDTQGLLHQAEVVRQAWAQVEKGTEEARLNIAKKGAAIAEALRTAPGAFVPSFLSGLEEIVQAHELAKQAAIDQANAAKRSAAEAAAEAKRQAREWEAAWDKARQEAVAAELKAAEETKRIAAQRIKDLAAGMEEAHQLAAKRAAEAWKAALASVEAGLLPLRRALDEVGRLDLDVDFARRSASVSVPTGQLRDIEQQYLEFLRNLGDGSVAAGEEMVRAGKAALGGMAEFLGLTVDQIKAKLGELNDLAAISQIRGAGATPLDTFRREQAGLERLRQVAADHHLDMEADFEARRLQLSQDFWSQQLGAWQGALDFLAGAFGGFFADLQRLVNSYQQGSQAGSALGGALGGAEGAAVGGVAGGIVGIWVAAYSWFTNKTKQDRAQSFGTAGAVSMSGGDWNESFSQLDGAQRRASHQIEATIEEFAHVIGGVFTSFADLEIQVRRDGKYFHAFVQGVLVGSFTDLQSATEAAILAAFRDPETMLRGVSDLVRQGFTEAVARGVSGLSLDELQGFLGSLREITEISWSDAARQMSETVRHFDDLWDSLERLDTASAAAAQGAADVATSELAAWQARIRSLTGEKESPEEQLARLRAEGELTKRQMEMRIADLRLREIELKEQKAELEAHAHLVAAGGDLGRREVESGVTYLQARAKLAEGEVDLYQAHIDAIQASLDAIALLIADLEHLAADFHPEDITLPSAGRSGSGGRAVNPLRQMIEDADRAFAQSGMSDYTRQLDDIDRKWREGIKETGLGTNDLARARKEHDAAIKAAAGDVEKIKKADEAWARAQRNIERTTAEINEANVAREREIQLLNEQARASAHEGLRQFEGASPFADLRQRAAGVAAAFADLLAAGAIGQEQYEAALGRANAALGRQLELLGRQESATLFGQLAGLLDAAGMKDSAEAAALIAEQQRANFVLQLAEAQLRYTQLVAEGVLIGKNRELVEGVIHKLEGLDLDKVFGQPITILGDIGAIMAQRAEEAAKRTEDAIKLRQKYEGGGVDPFERRLRDISDDFAEIYASLGRGAENVALFGEAVDAAFDDLKKPVKDWLDSLGLSQQSPLTGQQQLDLASSQFDAIMARLAGGELGAFGELAGAGDKLLELGGGQFGTAGDAYEKLFARVKAMGEQALTIATAMGANFSATGVLSPGNVSTIPLSTQAIIDAVAAGNKSAQQSAGTLLQLKRISEDQSATMAVMAMDIQGLRLANESLTRELALARNQRAG